MEISKSSWLGRASLGLMLALVGCAPGYIADSGEAPSALSGSVQIVVTAAMLHVDATRPAIGPYQALFDEQSSVGDPRGGTGVPATSGWSNQSWQAADYPMGFYVDLGQDYDLSEVSLFDTNDIGSFVIETGAPGAWTQRVSYTTSDYQAWKTLSISARTRYVHVTRDMSANVNELVLYGLRVGTGTSDPPPPPASGTEAKIPLSAAMAHTEAGVPSPGAYGALLDEQALAGDPVHGQAGTPVTIWDNQSWNAADYPAGFYLDLGQSYVVTQVAYFDANGIDSIAFDVGAPGAWVRKASSQTDQYLAWRTVPIGATTQYLRFTRAIGAMVGELVVYGYPASSTGTSPPPDMLPPPPPTSTRGVTKDVYASSATAGGYGYVVYTPPGYDQGTSFPLVVFLHGIGECGDGSASQLDRVRVNGPQHYIDAEGKDYPFILVSPQASWNWMYDVDSRLDPFIDFLVHSYKVDPKRVYLTGLSLGGGGTWAYAARHPDKLAGIVPVCGNDGDDATAPAQAMVASGLPVWAAHGLADTTVYPNNTTHWFDALGRALGGSSNVLDTYPSSGETYTAMYRPSLGAWQWIAGQTSVDASGAAPSYPALLTTYRSAGHWIWDTMYRDDQVWTWLLSKHR